MSRDRRLGFASTIAREPEDQYTKRGGESFGVTVFLISKPEVVYPLDGVLLLPLLATFAGAETFTGIARFGGWRLAVLRRYGQNATI